MFLIDVGDLLNLPIVLIILLDSSVSDLVREGEPDCLVLIFQKLTLHPQNLNIVQLCNVEGHLVALLQAVLELIVLNQLYIVSQLLVLILNLI